MDSRPPHQLESKSEFGLPKLKFGKRRRIRDLSPKAPRRSPRFLKQPVSPNAIRPRPSSSRSAKEVFHRASSDFVAPVEFQERTQSLHSEAQGASPESIAIASNTIKDQEQTINEQAAHLDEFMVLFEDMSNRRIDGDEEIRDMRQELVKARKLEQEAKNDLTILYAEMKSLGLKSATTVRLAETTSEVTTTQHTSQVSTITKQLDTESESELVRFPFSNSVSDS
ncbi:hypothetical protein C8R46DRAFT_1035826 [Mycena filopes]|nr:hypothetical protein C8R46DRAFT_1035826 [Mycena filopes]